MAEQDVPKDFFEFMQKMWNPMGFPIPGMIAPTMNIEDIEKKIAELKSVENWLTMNVGFVQMTVKTLEMQKAGLESLQAAAKGPQGIPLPKVPKDSPFGDFFEEFFNKKGGRVPPSDRKVSSLGSGFVIDPSGLVVTNNHVIEGADEIIINFHDGTKLKVDKVIGKDTKTDLALLKP